MKFKVSAIQLGTFRQHEPKVESIVLESIDEAKPVAQIILQNVTSDSLQLFKPGAEVSLEFSAVES